MKTIQVIRPKYKGSLLEWFQIYERYLYFNLANVFILIN